MRMVLFYIVIVFIVFVRTEEKFCGSKLSHTLKKFCISHNTPDQRIKRQIVTECCYNKCSVKYLVTNYCQNYDREALENYLQKANKTIQNDKDVGETIQKSPSFERRKRRKAKQCSCKSKAKKNKTPQEEILLFKKPWNIPRSKVGRIEEAERPFYILNRL